MFKSVFAKYVTAIAIIVLAGYFILSSIITTTINTHSAEQAKDAAKQMADLGADMVSLHYDNGNYADFEAFVSDGQNGMQDTLLHLIEGNTDVFILVADLTGDVRICSDNIAGTVPDELRSDRLPDSEEGDDGFEITTFSRNENGEEIGYFVYARYILDGDGERLGYLLSCVPHENNRTLLSATTRTIVMACLWIMLATLIAVYFITDRMTDPIKQMSVAAENYAKGCFDTRIIVGGRDEVAELSAAFNDMADSLDKLEKMRNTFLANVSHELRSPMASIAGFIDGIKSGAIPPEKQDYYLDIVSSEIQRLARLVSLLLDVSRLETGDRKMKFTRCNVYDIAWSVLVSLEQRIETKHLEVSFESERDEMAVRADVDALHQVIYNICENALKFSYEGGALSVSIRQGEHGMTELVIYNEGAGIPAEDLPYIFDRFYKSDKSRSMDKKGVGLGLYLVKTILKAHGGDITAESEEGKYCRFIMHIPTYIEK